MTKIIGTDAFLDPALTEYATKIQQQKQSKKKSNNNNNNNGYFVPSKMYFPADIYSLGITFATLCWQRVPQDENERRQMLENLSDQIVVVSKTNNQEGSGVGGGALQEFGGAGLVKLIHQMTNPEQKLRPTASQVVEELKRLANAALTERQKRQSANDGQRNRPLQEVLCQKCYVNFRDVAFRPCGHHVFCAQCCMNMRDEAIHANGGNQNASFSCPFCNVVVTGTVNVNADAPTKVFVS